MSGPGAAQLEGAASAKALKRENVWHVAGTRRRLVWLEQRSGGRDQGEGSDRDESESKVKVCRILRSR